MKWPNCTMAPCVNVASCLSCTWWVFELVLIRATQKTGQIGKATVGDQQRTMRQKNVYKGLQQLSHGGRSYYHCRGLVHSIYIYINISILRRLIKVGDKFGVLAVKAVKAVKGVNTLYKLVFLVIFFALCYATVLCKQQTVLHKVGHFLAQSLKLHTLRAFLVYVFRIFVYLKFILFKKNHIQKVGNHRSLSWLAGP